MDPNPVLRDGIERLIERIFGTYPEDYSFSDKGLKYDSSANTVKHIVTFVEVFRLLNVKELNDKSPGEGWSRFYDISCWSSTLDTRRAPKPYTFGELIRMDSIVIIVLLDSTANTKAKNAKAKKDSQSQKCSDDTDNSNSNGGNKNSNVVTCIATTSAAASVAAAATAVYVAIKTAAAAASTINSEQQSRDCKIKQQVQDEKAEQNREQYSNVQPADNLKHIGKVKRKIRQRIRDELAVQKQQAPFELAEAESTAIPETLSKPKPKIKRVRKSPSSPASSLQKKQRTD
ncbi:hypothetical protein BX661DRAFT_169759 [Kickxella alabastrina]|uniref:uncharacterized protein n=1 Tax=Kickxella alabastrina TaxID=61397 RepID=UPI00221E6E1B|nr:uncharacterized protein BX661DRAFT_169759 [Kickxella alabastrina]KAI7831900.1 hypothetical protein BX661DRAFT_169759 [Kickxella alabastrina]